jgi:acyl dehydratase
VTGATTGEADGLLYADDLVVGTVYELGCWFVSSQEIVDFAEAWDPQSFHLDREAGRQSRFGTIIGSGLHTLAILQRMAVDAVYSRWAVIAGRVMNDIQFTAPLRPDTTMTGTLTITAVVPVSPHRSLVRKRGIIRDADVQVLSMELETYVARQNPLEPRPR